MGIGNAFFAHNSVIYELILKYVIKLNSGDQKLPIEYHSENFWSKIKNIKLSAHIWAWAWHAVHLVQRSKNFTKSFPYRWGISAN